LCLGPEGRATSDDTDDFYEQQLAQFGAQMAESKAELDSITGRKRTNDASHQEAQSQGKLMFAGVGYWKAVVGSPDMPPWLKGRFTCYPEAMRNKVVVEFMTHFGELCINQDIRTQIVNSQWPDQFPMLLSAVAHQFVERNKVTLELGIDKAFRAMDTYAFPDVPDTTTSHIDEDM
jgi:hypothetical protein